MIDIYSRYIVGIRVARRRVRPLAEDMMAQVFELHGIPQVVHANRGTSMTSKTVAQLLATWKSPGPTPDRGVERQPLLRGLFRTLKTPRRFPNGSIRERGRRLRPTSRSRAGGKQREVPVAVAVLDRLVDLGHAAASSQLTSHPGRYHHARRACSSNP